MHVLAEVWAKLQMLQVSLAVYVCVVLIVAWLVSLIFQTLPCLHSVLPHVIFVVLVIGLRYQVIYIGITYKYLLYLI